MKIKLKLLGLILLLTIGGAGFIFNRWLNQASVDINQLIIPSPDSEISLILEPTFIVKESGTAAAISLTIDTGADREINRVEIELTYTKNTCLTPKVALGDFLPRTIMKPEIKNSTIKFITANQANDGVSGNGQLATITTGPAKGDCQIKFTENTRIIDADTNTQTPYSATNTFLKLKNIDPNLPSFKQPVYKPDTLTR